MKISTKSLILATVFLFLATSLFAQSGRIRGVVRDQETEEPLPGANIIIQGTNMGDATDINGEYVITNVAPGTYTIVASYIGYQKAQKEVGVQVNRTTTLDFALQPESIQAEEEVVITAQASGQMQAMNQQISSKSIKNVVSKASIQELPEATAAEAVGRLPGVSLQRAGGEGSKVVIRGLAPKYSKIQIDGVTMAATSSGDRSTDLSMISPYMLEGIELTKSVTADMEGDATGGIVNFKIKEAPEEPTLSAIGRFGYNDLENTYSDYKLSVGGSRRFYSNLFGVYARFDLERKNASSEEFDPFEYYQETEDTPVDTRQVRLLDANRQFRRAGAALVMDYSTDDTKIKFSNFTSYINRTRKERRENYDLYRNSIGKGFLDNKTNLLVMNNSLRLRQYLNNWQINGGISYSLSENETPRELELGVSPIAGVDPFGDTPPTTRKQDPYEIPNLVVVDNYLSTLGNFSHQESYTQETELAVDAKISYNFDITNSIGVDLQFGGKYKRKDKEYDNTVKDIPISTGGPKAMSFRNMIIDMYDLGELNENQYNRSAASLYYTDAFMDPNFRVNDFLDGRYVIEDVPNVSLFREIDDRAEELGGKYRPNKPASYLSDYWGHEDYWAVFINPEISIGSDFTFIPGVRYESNRTEYTGMRADTRDFTGYTQPLIPDTTTKVRQNDYFLPMIHLFYEPLPWFNIKAGFTKTLQRPNYNSIIPSWNIGRSFVSWNNFQLRPEKSINYDLQLSVFTDRVGLFSAGIFYKDIEDMIFYTGQRAIVDTTFYGLPPFARFKKTAYSVNNENPVTDYGFEVEWKSNFWYLPGALRGLVINVNYTRNISSAKYLRTRIKTEYDEYFRPILTNNDTTYTAPMILQPDHLFNLTVGYDYKGFSIRWAMRFKSHIFKSANWYESLRAYSTDFYRYDISIKQKLPVEGLELFLNGNNVTSEFERDVINYRDLTTYEEHYGLTADVGVRYTF